MNDLIIYNTEDGKSNVALLVVENEAWLTQNQLAELLTPLCKIYPNTLKIS